MSGKRILALLASLVATVAMALGLTATAAQATKPYPPPPPSLYVKPTAKVGATVSARVTNAKRKTIVVTVYFRAKNSSGRTRIHKKTVVVGRSGRFTYSFRAPGAGILFIYAQAVGATPALAVVTVRTVRRNGRSVQMRRVSYTGASTVAAPPAGPSSGDGGLAIAGLLALAGGAVFTQQAMRRRRRA